MALATASSLASADIFWMFRESDGATNWQYIANFSSSVLIIALTVTAIRLYVSHRRAARYNRQLEEIRTELELRVDERTATLRDSNIALEVEVGKHRKTTRQLRQSETYINSILQSMPLMLIGLDKTHKITQWNHFAETTTGVSSKQALGSDLWDIYPAISITPEQVNQAQEKGETLTIKYSQRGQYHFNITIYPLEGKSKTGVVILLDDVSQQVNNETMLIQRDKMSSMGEMASVMAHDINIPLKAIIKDIKTVREGLTDTVDRDEVSELLEDAIIRGQQATSVISNLINFSSSGGGEKILASIPAIIDHSIELASDVLSVTAGLRFSDIEVNVDYADNLQDIPCYVTELQQVMLSLFRYSCYALDEIDDLEHNPQINVEVTIFYDNLWIRIQHNGRGISLDEQKTLFEPYSIQAGGSDKSDANQRLSFSHFIITEQHQGQIAVTSHPDIGTTFHIQMPLQ
jgi:PAS domain S-box-containing protein